MTQDEKGAIKIAIVLILLLCWFRRKDKMLQKAPAILEQNESKYPVLWMGYNPNIANNNGNSFATRMPLGVSSFQGLRFETKFIPRRYSSSSFPISIACGMNNGNTSARQVFVGLNPVTSNLNCGYCYYNTNSQNPTVSNVLLGETMILGFDMDSMTFNLNGVSYTIPNTTQIPDAADWSKPVFNFGYVNTANGQSIQGGFIHCKVWQSGSLIHDVRPSPEKDFSVIDLCTGVRYLLPVQTASNILSYDEPPLPL
jgi:hypothetical protein